LALISWTAADDDDDNAKRLRQSISSNVLCLSLLLFIGYWTMNPPTATAAGPGARAGVSLPVL